jgi:FAD binding domain
MTTQHRRADTDRGAMIDQLRAEVAGPVFGGGDDYAAEIAAQNTAVVHTPEVVVGVAAEADAVAVIRAAADNGLPIRVFATGHGSHKAVTDGLLVTTSRLCDVTIDAPSRVAHIGAGCRWSKVVEAAAELGLAPITGSSGHVGAVGYLLGGGIGPLSRTFGFSSDRARGFRVATAAGEVVTANGTENPDLYWALRGGKGGLGIVTSMDVELVELSTLYGGSLFFAAEHIAAVLRTWVDWTKTVPEAATSSVAIMRLPPLEFIPEPLRGRTVLSLRYAYVGADADGERLFQPMRDVAPALMDGVGPLPAAQIGLIHNDPTEPGPVFERGRMLNEIDGDFVTTLLDAVGPDQEVPVMIVEVRHIGGATHRDVPEGSAVGGRCADYGIMLLGAPDPSLFDHVLPHVTHGILTSLAPWASAENNINYIGGAEGSGEYEVCWPPATLARLAEVRATHDPNGLFPFGHPHH